MRPAAYSTAPLHQPAAQPKQQRTADVYPFPASPSSKLLNAYRAALAELDARPAQYTAHAHATSTGAALLLQHSIEAADAAVRAKKRDEEAAAAAAAELRRQQIAHPLYNTLHRSELLRYWQTHGHAPHIPDRALDDFTQYIQRHAGADDAEIREIAERLEKAHKTTLQERLGPYSERFLRAKDPTERTAKNLRRVLRAATRQYNETAAHILHLVHKNGQQYVSDMTRNARQNQLKLQADWIAHTVIIDKTKENPTEKDRIPLADCIRTAEHRFSELYTLVRGQEKYFTAQNYVPLFITLTSPAEYHPHPTAGTDSWDGSSVADSHDWFNQGWKLARAALAKRKIHIDGFRVTEPHKDGAEHWHLLCYVKESQLQTVRSTIAEYFAHSAHAVQFKADFTGPARPGKATAAGYMMKYLIKTVNSQARAGTSAANDAGFAAEADAADAWRSTWGIRAFQFFGVLHGQLTKWREFRRIETQPEAETDSKLWKAARGGRANRYIATIVEDEPELKTIHELKTDWTDPDENGETQEFQKKGRIIGISVNKQTYITHTTAYRLETDYKNEHRTAPVTVIHKNPSVQPEQKKRPPDTPQKPPRDTESGAIIEQRLSAPPPRSAGKKSRTAADKPDLALRNNGDTEMTTYYAFQIDPRPAERGGGNSGAADWIETRQP